ncbi:hypothetical protein [Streptomyces sp. YIM 98790]|uniref:hypothetical protein n=1 Tax=Streptomyces sp. YIM 98790 TaxID=2689077 RepID=UPI0014096A6E|nr:hypothetical protein [Streptomyces sp. YIM 98790]
MALVRKGSRRIVVDGVAYRWRLRRKPAHGQGLGSSPCVFAVEHADNPGTALVVTTSHPHPGNWVGRISRPVLPSDVARGWAPQAYGSPFHLDLSDGFAPWG